MKFHACKKIKFKKPIESHKERVILSWVDVSPTAYKIRSDGGKQFLAKNSSIENFSKYLKNKNIVDIIIYYTRNNYNMYVKSVRIFRSAAKKVSHIFADTVESFFWY